MVKTTDLVADLKVCVRGECSACGHECGNADCLDRIMEDAADKIEELMKANDSLKDAIARRDKQIEDMKQGMAQLAKAVAVKEEQK